MVDLTGRIVLVTGGNGGIGYYSAKKLLEKNAKVYIGARDSQKSHNAIKALKEETGREPILIPLDLSDLHNVRKAAEIFLSKESKLDVLLNNAGVMAQPIDQLTKDGYDGQFGVNVLGHFHLTTLLLPALLATPSPRVINVSSVGHNFAPGKIGFYWEKLKGPKKGSMLPVVSFIERYRYYGQSKLGNILLTNELVRRYGDKGLISIAVHPGFINTELTRYHNSILAGLTSKLALPTSLGAVTQLFAATSPEAAELNGKYLVPLAQVGAPSANALDKELGIKMWDYCENELKAF
jgi:NAD(P)-dependent dehydrogenase (short-subunit alcohol dehydrogenase family)